jgi:seryl-tRNA synthetase
LVSKSVRPDVLDLKWLREQPEAFDRALARRGLPPMAQELVELDTEIRGLQTELQQQQAARNVVSREFAKLRSEGRANEAEAKALALKVAIQAAEEMVRRQTAAIEARLAKMPNVLDEDVPDGPDESANVELRRWGEPRRFDFEPREHDEVGARLGMDFGRAAKLSGARFVVLSGALARLERALAAFMLDLHTSEHGYTEISPPLLVRDEVMFGTAQLPKFEDDQFFAISWEGINAELASPHDEGGLEDRLKNDPLGEFYFFLQMLRNDRRALIPTAEVPLTNLVREDIIDQETLPRRYTAWTPCFRAEAGAAGKDTKGMIRQHQFSKVELVSIVEPEESKAEHERLTACAEEVLKRLNLPYRVMVLCSGDTGFAARKTYDIEVWLPGQGRYREISSCSNCGDFQARRMRARFRPERGRQTELVHTLNGSGLAVGRTLIALLENGQQADGSVVLPTAIRPYMGGLERLTPDG